MDEYIQTFNDISAAQHRLMRRCVQSIATNALKTVYPLELLGETADAAPYAHIFAKDSDNPLVYYTDIRFLVPTSIDKLSVRLLAHVELTVDECAEATPL